ncbi:hypothetical protein ACYULU_09310 [Breznakiellaceae bacterium SP9]
MNLTLVNSNNASNKVSIPREFRETAENLFPPDLHGSACSLEAVLAFTELLGIEADYQNLLELQKTGREMHRFLGHFQNNLDLLIQKIWVSQGDIARKERLQAKIPGFIADFEQGNYRYTLAEFGNILNEIFYLFFGRQSYQEDFSEYIFRIDPQIGLFWWYSVQIRRLHSELAADNTTIKDNLWAILLIGICYLTNF